jgi:hypothetical protein
MKPMQSTRRIRRVGIVLSFFSSRRNWDSPNPSPAGECTLPQFWGEGHTHWRKRGWESPNSDEETYTVKLFIYVLCASDVNINTEQILFRN